MDAIDPRIETGLLFRQAEIRAEGLVGWLRMIVATGLGLILVFSITRGELQDLPMLARQWSYALATVAAYFIMGIVAVGVVRTGLFRHWMVWVFATGDCLFILVGVWLGLQNTGLPGTYAFAFPSIWLVPLVLSFGALRFDPWVPGYIAVLIVGGVFALAYIVPTPAGPPDLQTVNLFLSSPPNGMRLTMLALACAALALASLRARRLLLRALTEAQRSGNLTRYLPAQMAPQLAGGELETLRQGRREEMAILFMDMRGFTGLSEGLMPQEVSQLITDYRARIIDAARATGGVIDKFMGDAALVVFENADDPKLAARAALTFAERIGWGIADWSAERVAGGKPPVRAGVGIHWGRVFCGVVGDGDRLEYSIFGDAVNIAARLEELTKKEDVMIIASRALLDKAGLPPAPRGWRALRPVTPRGRSGRIEIMGCPSPAK